LESLTTDTTFDGTTQKTVPAVESIAKRLIHLHPEQLHRAIIYPVPPMGAPMYNMAKPLLGHELTDLITILQSNEGTGRHAPPPKAALLDYVDDATVEGMEALRLDLFRPRDKPAAEAPAGTTTVGTVDGAADAAVMKVGDGLQVGSSGAAATEIVHGAA
jgi:hypothetical protein